jgi:hypothetical protein
MWSYSKKVSIWKTALFILNFLTSFALTISQLLRESLESLNFRKKNKVKRGGGNHQEHLQPEILPENWARASKGVP